MRAQFLHLTAHCGATIHGCSSLPAGRTILLRLILDGVDHLAENWVHTGGSADDNAIQN